MDNKYRRQFSRFSITSTFCVCVSCMKVGKLFYLGYEHQAQDRSISKDHSSPIDTETQVNGIAKHVKGWYS